MGLVVTLGGESVGLVGDGEECVDGGKREVAKRELVGALRVKEGLHGKIAVVNMS